MTKWSAFFAASALGLFSLFGCSAIEDANPFPAKSGRCELRPAKQQCTDWRNYKGPSMLTQQGVCTTLANAVGGGKVTPEGWTEGKTCDPSGMWGGCQTKSADGTEQTNWFYQSDDFKTIDEAKAKCDNATWVEPK